MCEVTLFACRPTGPVGCHRSLVLALGCSPGALASARSSVPGPWPGPCPGPPVFRLLVLLLWFGTGCALHMLCSVNHVSAA